MIAPATKVQAAAEKAAFEVAEAERLRFRIKKLLGDIRRLTSNGAIEAAKVILPNRCPSTIQSFARWKQVAEALEAVWTDFSTENGRCEMSYRCGISPSRSTGRENINKTCRAQKQGETQPVRTSPTQVALLASRSLREVIELYWNALDNRAPLSWQPILMAAKDRAYQLGIRSGVWQRHCELLGEERTALCLMIADRNAERLDGYRVRDAAGAFIEMARSEARQSAVISSLLGELISNVEGPKNGA